MAAPIQQRLHTTFKEIKVHTAKCDECNKHNSLSIYRCLDCNQQCCTPCWNKKGGDGKHVLKSDSTTAQQPVILKAEDVQKTRPSKKKTTTKQTRKAPKKPLGTFFDGDDKMIEDTDEVKPPTIKSSTAKSTKQAHKKLVKTNNAEAALHKDDVETEEEDWSGSQASHPVATKTAKTGIKALAKSNALKNKTINKARANTPSSNSSQQSSSKRKFDSASAEEIKAKYGRDYSWAFQHAGEEGNKRLRTSIVSSSADPNKPVRDEPKNEDPVTRQHAGYLLDLARSAIDVEVDAPRQQDGSGDTKSTNDSTLVSDSGKYHTASPKEQQHIPGVTPAVTTHKTSEPSLQDSTSLHTTNQSVDANIKTASYTISLDNNNKIQNNPPSSNSIPTPTSPVPPPKTAFPMPLPPRQSQPVISWCSMAGSAPNPLSSSQPVSSTSTTKCMADTGMVNLNNGNQINSGNRYGNGFMEPTVTNTNQMGEGWKLGGKGGKEVPMFGTGSGKGGISGAVRGNGNDGTVKPTNSTRIGISSLLNNCSEDNTTTIDLNLNQKQHQKNGQAKEISPFPLNQFENYRD